MTNTQSHIGGAEMHTEEIKMLKALASIAPSHVKEALEAAIKALEAQEELEVELDILKGTVRANLRHFSNHDVSDLGEAHINKLFEIVINETDKRAKQAHQEGYNEGVHQASEIVYFAADELAGRLNDGEGITVNDCENILQECWLSIRALKKECE